MGAVSEGHRRGWRPPAGTTRALAGGRRELLEEALEQLAVAADLIGEVATGEGTLPGGGVQRLGAVGPRGSVRTTGGPTAADTEPSRAKWDPSSSPSDRPPFLAYTEGVGVSGSVRGAKWDPRSGSSTDLPSRTYTGGHCAGCGGRRASHVRALGRVAVHLCADCDALAADCTTSSWWRR